MATADPAHHKACASLLSIRGQTEEARTTIPQPPECKPQSQKANQNEEKKDYVPNEGTR